MILPPTWLINAINRFRTFLIRLNRRTFPGSVVLYEQFQNFWVLPCLYVAAKLNIAGHLEEKPRSSSDIANRVKADPEAIYRLMRALAGVGIFKQQSNGSFALNSLSRGLLDGPQSLRYMILHHLGPVNWNLLGDLEHAVRSGNDAFSHKYGMGIYDYLKNHPDESSIFDKSMSNLSFLGLDPILNAYDFSKFPVIADIGGGEGFLLSNILSGTDKARGILFDTAEALTNAPALIEGYGLSDRINLITGDFFKEVPLSADLYILKNIIHNWNDDLCTKLLKNISDRMDNHSRILVIDMVVPVENEPSLSKLLDIQMLATMPGGKERTKEEFLRLIENSGLHCSRVIPTISPISLIEIRKN